MRSIWFFVVPILPSAVCAQDVVCVSGETGLVCDPAPSDAPVKSWEASAWAGVAGRDSGASGTFQGIALTRSLASSYVRGSVMRYRSTIEQSDAALPSTYLVGTLGAGGSLDGWTLDVWASLGRQDYGRIATAGGSRESTGASGSTYTAAGVMLGKSIALDARWYLTPTVAGTRAKGKLLRPAPAGVDAPDYETDEPAWAWSAGVRVDRRVGADGRHYLGASLSRQWTSNAVSQLAQPELLPPLEPGLPPQVPATVSAVHFSDAWLEGGVSGNFRLNDALWLDVGVSRSFGALAGNTTTLQLGLRMAF